MKMLIWFIFLLGCTQVSSQLNPTGSNVCKKTVEQDYRYYVNVVYQAVEYYRTCCGWTWPGCWDPCTKSRRVQRVRSEPRVKKRNVTLSVCCPGWMPQGDHCPLPKCDKPCVHGICAGPNRCECRSGYEGETCSQDIDECQTNNGGCEQICNNYNGTFACGCDIGFTRAPDDEKRCNDVDECSAISDLCSCSNDTLCNVTCLNQHGSYECLCSKGFEADKKRFCNNIDECNRDNGNCSQLCFDSPGSYNCACYDGYTLNSDKHTCDDINECLQANGGCDHTCNNTIGGFYCQCNQGFVLDGNGETCSDKNECLTSDHGCEYCQNRQGSYICACPSGYHLNADNKTCSDTNECLEVNIGGRLGSIAGCSQICTNTNGSFECSCNEGYKLKRDYNKTCEDIDECELGTAACDHICINIIGSYICRCKPGYFVGDDHSSCVGFLCEDIPPISNGLVSCSGGRTGDVCTFTCSDGYTLEGSSEMFCQPNQRWNGSAPICKRKTCPEFQAPLYSSLVLPCQTFYESTCKLDCIEGYTLLGPKVRECSVTQNGEMLWKNDSASCEKSTACLPNPCQNSGQCRINGDTFSCLCADTGYKGQTCEIGIVKTPQIPLLTENVIRRGLSIQARPNVKLNVEIISSDPNVTVTPANVTLTDSITSVEVSILGKKRGFYILAFKLSGHDAKSFEKPPNSVVYVIGQDFNVSNPMLPDGSLIKGCFVDNKPEGTVYSNSEWNSDRSSNGIIQIEGLDGNRVPLSFSGGAFENGTFNGFKLTKGLTGTISSSPKTQNNKNCFDNNNPSGYIGALLKENAFLNSVLKMFNSYSPYWVKLIAPLNIENYASRDLGGNLFKGEELIRKRTPCTKGLILNPYHLYYLYETNQFLTAHFVNKNVTLPSTIQKCFVKSFSTNNVYFVIIPDRRNDTAMQSFSDAVINLLQLNGTIDRVGFTMSDEHKVMFSYGNNEFRIDNGNKNLYLAVNGIFSWRFSNITNIFSPSHIEQSKVSDGTIEMKIEWTAASSQQSIMLSGKVKTVIFNHSISDKKCNESAISGSVTESSLKLSNDIDNILTFNPKGSIDFTLLYSRNHQEIDQHVDNIDLIKISQEEANELEEIKTFLNSITNEPPSIMDSITELVLIPDQIIAKSRALVDSIDTLSVNEKGIKIMHIRLSYLDALKRFHILLNRYLDVDFLDTIGMEDKFDQFQKLLSRKLSHLPYLDKVYFSQLRFLKLFMISGNGTICLQNVCFYETKITISHGSSCQHHLDVTKQSTLLTAITSEDVLFGGLIRINPATTIAVELPESILTTTATFNGSISIYGGNKTVRVKMRDSNISIRVDAEIVKGGIAHLRISASIAKLAKTDPVLFHVRGAFKQSSLLFEDLTATVQQKLKIMGERVESRLLLIRLNQERTEIIAQRKAVSYHQNMRKLYVLLNQLTSLSRNISTAESNYDMKRLEFARVANDSQLSMAYRKIRAQLLAECSPQICLSECIPGAIVESCQSESYAHIVKQNCSSVYQKVDTFELVLVNKTETYTGLNVETRCRTKCPPLTGFLRNVFGKRKRRGLLKHLFVKGLAVAFRHLGGKEGQIGATVGGVFLGPVGAVIGGLIGSAFGSCDKICDVHFIPKTVRYHLSRYEQHPKKVDVKTFELCENYFQKVRIGFNMSEPCQSYSKCAAKSIDSQCVLRNQQCSELYANLSMEISDPKYQQSYEALTEAGILLSLLRRKQNVLLQRKTSLQELADISMSTSMLANESRRLAISAESDFRKQISGEMQLVNAYKSNKNLMVVKDVSFGFSILGGMKFPRRILLEIASTYNQTNTISSNAFFDIDNYPGAIDDISEKMIQDAISQSVKKSRKRRSLSEYPGGSQLNEKCLAIEDAGLEIYDIARSLTEHINQFNDHYAKYIESKRNSENEVSEYIMALQSQSTLSYGNHSNNIDDIVTELTEDIKLQNDEALTNRQWSESLETFFTILDMKFETNEFNKCFGFTDCVEYHLQTILALIKHEQNEIANKARLNIPFWNHTILTLYKELPPLEIAKNLSASLLDSIVKTHPKDLFCGVSPVIDADLSGEIKAKENDEVEVRIRIKQTIHEYDITWKKENLVIVHQHSASLKVIATKESASYYTCEIENKFGKTYCGKVLITVYTKPVFDRHPESVLVYMNSPGSTYLNCNASSIPPPKFKWYFENFFTHEIKMLTDTKSVLTVKQDTVERSGFYHCVAYNDLQSSESRKAIVNVLSTTTAVERILVSFNTKASAHRQKRSNVHFNNTNNVLNPDHLQIKTKLASLMNVSSDSLQNVNYQKTSETMVDISFELYSKNFTKLLIQATPVPSWEAVSDDMVKEREILFLRSLLLFYESNRTRVTFNIDGDEFVLEPNSIAVEGMKVACPIGQIVLENGYICGDCPAGTKYDEEDQKCVDCEQNMYNPIPRQINCISCPNEQQTATRKSVSKLQCKDKPKETTTQKPETTTKAPTTRRARRQKDDKEEDLIKIVVPVVVCVLFVIIVGIIIFIACRRRPERKDVFGTRENPVFEIEDDDNIDSPYTTVKANAINVNNTTTAPEKIKKQEIGSTHAYAEPNIYDDARVLQNDHALQFENSAYANSLNRDKPTSEKRSNNYDHLDRSTMKSKHYEGSFQPLKLGKKDEENSEYDRISIKVNGEKSESVESND